MGVCWVLYTLVLCVMIPRISVALKIINIASDCLAGQFGLVSLVQ